MSYTQRHSHESLPPCLRSEYKEKRNIFFTNFLSSKDFFQLHFPSGIVLRWQSFGVLPIPLSLPSLSRTSANTHAHIHSPLYEFSFLLVFISSHFMRIRMRICFSSQRSTLALFLSVLTHIHTHAYLCRLL